MHPVSAACLSTGEWTSDQTVNPARQREKVKTTGKTIHYYVAAAVGAVTCIVYLPALQNQFVILDDNAYVLDNPYIRTFNLKLLHWAFFNFYAANWHPLTWLSHAFDYAVWGLNPFGHHLTNIVLHSVNTVLVVLLSLQLLETAREQRDPESGRSRSRFSLLLAGATSGLLFGLHPLHVESAAWVAERKDVLCALFFLASVGMYLAYARSRAVSGAQRHRFTSRSYLSSLFFFLLALLSKPMAVTLPCVLLILDAYPLNRIPTGKALYAAVVEKLPFFIFSAASAFITVLAQRSGGAVASTDVAPALSRPLIASHALVGYLWNMVLPLHLLPFYPYPRPEDVSLLNPTYASALLIVLSITIAGVWLVVVKRQKWLLAVWGYFVVTLMPVLGFVQVGGQSMADRYAYLPSIGPFLVVGFLFGSLAETAERSVKWRRLAGGAGVVLICAILSILTVKQIGIWKNSFTVLDYLLEKTPRTDPRVHLFRGLAYEQVGDLEHAISDYTLAIALNPAYEQARLARGKVLQKIGRYQEALADYDAVLRLNARSSDAFIGRGGVWEQMGNDKQAIEEYSAAIANNPDAAGAYINRGLLYKKRGERERAMSDFERSIAISPEDHQAYYNLGVLYLETGMLTKAIEEFSRCIALEPGYGDAVSNRAVAYAMAGQPEAALHDFTRAVTLDPGSGVTYFNRGKLYASLGNKELARSDFAKACSLGDSAGCAAARDSERTQ